MSTYTFSASSHHSESNDMRQPHVLTNMLRNSGTWVSDDVTTSKMAKISKSRQNLEGYPRSFFLIGSWLTKTGVKKWFQFNGHRTPDFDPTIDPWTSAPAETGGGVFFFPNLISTDNAIPRLAFFLLPVSPDVATRLSPFCGNLEIFSEKDGL